MKFFLQLCIILGFPAQAATLEKLEDYAYLGENICVKGMLVDYKGVSQIHLRSLDQIKINKE